MRTAPGVAALTFAALVLLAGTSASYAQVFSREQDIPDLRLGQKVMVDDGSCPAGQIKEVQGTKMDASGVQRTRKCVPRLGPKSR